MSELFRVIYLVFLLLFRGTVFCILIETKHISFQLKPSEHLFLPLLTRRETGFLFSFKERAAFVNSRLANSNLLAKCEAAIRYDPFEPNYRLYSRFSFVFFYICKWLMSNAPSASVYGNLDNVDVDPWEVMACFSHDCWEKTINSYAYTNCLHFGNNRADKRGWSFSFPSLYSKIK